MGEWCACPAGTVCWPPGCWPAACRVLLAAVTMGKAAAPGNSQMFPAAWRPHRVGALQPLAELLEQQGLAHGHGLLQVEVQPLGQEAALLVVGAAADKGGGGCQRHALSKYHAW